MSLTVPNPIMGKSVQLGTEQATTSGTTIDFTSIPSGVKRVGIHFEGVSSSGTNVPIVRLGTSGGIVSTGYESTGATITHAAATETNNGTSGFIIGGTAAAGEGIWGTLWLSLKDATNHDWIASGVFEQTTTKISFCGGSCALAAELTRLRILWSGSDTFDNGSINITWEF